MGEALSYLLEEGSVAGYLRRRGVVPADAEVRAEALPGGVSNDVLAVRGAGVDVVVKQALPRLRVAQEWLAPTTRILIEADALRLAARLDPGSVPDVVDVDDDAMTLTITRAPESLRNYKSDLLSGRIDPDTPRALAAALARWHAGTAGDEAVARQFPDDAFIQLRIDPFYGRIAEVHPDLRRRVDEAAAAMLANKRCLVHGDFSPKNVLADGAHICVLDWEVAHYGDPVFDLAFLQTHLLLKAIHRPESAAEYQASWRAFYDAYSAAGLDVDPDYLTTHTGCLTLARVDGKSPVEYLDADQRDQARQIARDALTQPASPMWGAISD